MKDAPSSVTFTHHTAHTFLEQCTKIGSNFHQERSIKIQPNTVTHRRILLGIEKKQKSDQEWAGLFKQLNMPADASALLYNQMDNANTLLFAIEEGKSTTLKVYLEFWDHLVQLIQQGKHTHEAFALNQGIKWSPNSPESWVQDTYWCYPMLKRDEIIARLDALLPDQIDTFASVISALLANNTQFPAKSDLIYMEVSDTNSLRRSFDINCYKKGLQVKDLFPAAMQFATEWSTATDFEKHILPFMDCPLGHVSAGVNREKTPFLTLYFELP